MNYVENNWGLITSQKQSKNIGCSYNLNNELLVIPSSSYPSWSNTFLFDFKEKGVILNNISLLFTMPGMSGLTGVNGVYSTPCAFWINTCEIIIGGIVVDTLYGQSQYIRRNLFSNGDEDRKAYNSGASSLTSLTLDRYNPNTYKLAYGGQYILDLDCIFNQSIMHVFHEIPDIQLRIRMNPMSNAYLQTYGILGTAIYPITSCQLLVKVSRTNEELNNISTCLLKRHGMFHYLYHSTLYMPVIVLSGLKSISIPLTGISGNVAGLYFTVQTSSDLVFSSGLTYFNSTTSNNTIYKQINSYHIISNSATSLCGGQNISDSMSRFYLSKYYFDSTFLADTTETPNYVYFYSFSTDIKKAVQNGSCLGSHQFYGSEVLQINFLSALTESAQVNIYALVETCLEIGSDSSVRKLYISN